MSLITIMRRTITCTTDKNTDYNGPKKYRGSNEVTIDRSGKYVSGKCFFVFICCLIDFVGFLFFFVLFWLFFLFGLIFWGVEGGSYMYNYLKASFLNLKNYVWKQDKLSFV